MFPVPTHIYMDYSIDKQLPGKPIEKIPFEKVTEKELFNKISRSWTKFSVYDDLFCLGWNNTNCFGNHFSDITG